LYSEITQIYDRKRDARHISGVTIRNGDILELKCKEREDFVGYDIFVSRNEAKHIMGENKYSSYHSSQQEFRYSSGKRAFTFIKTH